jgi:hypothetical protein
LNTNLTKEQKDYAIFLPAISGFFATFIGKQRREEYVDKTRIPSNFPNDVESMNWLNPSKSIFEYNWSLYSAGHAELDVNKDAPKELMIRDRDRNTSWLLGDSGGFQIGKGVWEGDWKDPNCPKAKKKREQVLTWMDAYMDYGMILDIPAWVSRSPAGQKATGITNYQDAVNATRINNDYFMQNRTGACKFLNVLQGENFAQADDWYEQMKKFSDPKQYPDAHFNGWSMGGKNMCDIHLALKRLVTLRFDGLLEKGKQDFMHFLGTSKLEWGLMLTAVQRAVRKYHNENFTVTYDCASPFLCTANGQQYTNWRLDHNGKWSYIMEPAPDNKAFSKDTRPWDEECAKHHTNWNPSPLSEGLLVNDVCKYGPGDLNKNNKEGNTSWDSFSYFLMMNHNVYTHIRSVQEANKAMDSGSYPNWLVNDTFERQAVCEMIDRVFEIDDRDKALEFIDTHQKLWMMVPGTRGAIGKKTVNASSQFNALFEEE